ncbi:hypothetical protein OH807_31235 [Kitasatospora sp. NBC_01560]|uniref:hypothetical protein n=1 Tax=Kitasatospora sp. NBC_01560 TaxID=2975965 RepID=UPI00386FD1AC
MRGTLRRCSGLRTAAVEVACGAVLERRPADPVPGLGAALAHHGGEPLDDAATF